MPIAVSAYFAIYITFCLWAHYDDFTNRNSASWFAIVEMASNVFLLLAALSFWLPSLRAIPSSLLFALFAFGCMVFFVQGIVVGRKHAKDQGLSSAGKVFTVFSGAVLGVLVTGPLLYWGWQSTVRIIHAET
ncbi:hypothetical protein [Polaromonas naphthalenivorans]|uniref:hypothetical protein n=1 Tax=Polaromonas naphthalenivorans TaxID=216465 RepID=UPI0012ECBF3D|nr:hypothetical protein [Polaromonas naphthalenivorans]